MDFEEKQKDFSSFYYSNMNLLHRAGDAYRSLVSSLLATDFLLQSVTYRVKEERECIDKFKRKYLTKLESTQQDYQIRDYITDLIGVRIVCLYSVDINRIGDALKAHFDAIDETNKSVMLDSTEDQFGYRGLHLDLKLNSVRNNLPEYSNFNSFRFEVQIRSIIQDAWSVLDHKIKYKKSIPPQLKRSINRLAALFEIADDEFLRVKNETDILKQAAIDAVAQSNESPTPNLLDVFSFQQIVEGMFPKFKCIPSKTDEFISQVNGMDSSLTTNDFLRILENELKIVDKYQEFQLLNNGNTLNVVTKIRHALYLHDKEKFANILFGYQKKSFDEWLSNAQQGSASDNNSKQNAKKAKPN